MADLKALLAEKRRKAEAAKNEQQQTAVSVSVSPDSSGTGTGVSGVSSPAPATEPIQQTEVTTDAEKPAQVTAKNVSTDAESGESDAEIPPEILKLKMDLADLRHQLDNQIPGFATLLRDIHIKLREDPAVVTVLSPDEVKTIVTGLSRHTDIEVVAPKAMKSAKAAVRGRTIQADDL